MKKVFRGPKTEEKCLKIPKNWEKECLEEVTRNDLRIEDKDGEREDDMPEYMKEGM